MTLEYEPAQYGPDAAARKAVVRPYLIEPSLQTHALYLIGWDETRDALRTFKIERIRDVALTPRTFELPEGDGVEATLRRAWDIIADQPPTTVVLRFSPTVATRVEEATWHPSQRVQREADGSLTGARPSPAPSRSASGSCPGATTWRCSSRPSCGPTWRPRCAARWPLRGLNRGPVRATDSTAAGSVG